MFYIADGQVHATLLAKPTALEWDSHIIDRKGLVVISLEQIQKRIVGAAATARQTAPLAGSITNFVTIDFVANAQLAAGGSAAMVYLPDEGEALGSMSEAFYVNVGTLMPSHEETMCRTATSLHDAGTPWVLDPVGIGMGAVRCRILLHMKEATPTIIRCNASEAIALANLWELEVPKVEAGVKGVDSTDSVDAAREPAMALARHINGAVAVSGEVDLVTDGATVTRSMGGSPLMEKVTGFGCALGGVTAVYAACADAFTAALCGTAAFNLAATRAAAKTHAPASFKVAFLDELFLASPEDISLNPLVLEEA